MMKEVSAGKQAGEERFVHFHLLRDRRGVCGGRRRAGHFCEAGALTPADLAAGQRQVRARVLRWFAPCAGASPPAIVLRMAGWHHGGGFSLDASVRLEGPDSRGLKRLLRYSARQPPLSRLRHHSVCDDTTCVSNGCFRDRIQSA